MELLIFSTCLILCVITTVVLTRIYMKYKKSKRYDFYLAGPMSGIKDHNMPAFREMASLLRKKGFSIWNPAEHEITPEWSFDQCMKVDLNAVVNKCDGIALMPGWRNSIGANTEAFCALVCGKRVIEVCANRDCVGEKYVKSDVISLEDYRLPYQLRHSQGSSEWT